MFRPKTSFDIKQVPLAPFEADTMIKTQVSSVTIQFYVSSVMTTLTDEKLTKIAILLKCLMPSRNVQIKKMVE